MRRPRFVMVCDEASGNVGLDVYPMPIADFAKLFTYGRTVHYEGGECIGETYEIRLVEPTGSATRGEGET